MERLQQIYEDYDRRYQEAVEKAPAFSGFFGVGDVVKNHPCHMDFYEAVGAWTEALAAQAPESDRVAEAVRWILSQGGENWYHLAAHGQVRILIPLLKPQDRRTLGDWYEKSYPRRKRLPVQNEILKLLKK